MEDLVKKLKPLNVSVDKLLLDPNNPRYQGDFPDYVFIDFHQIADEEVQQLAMDRICIKRFEVMQLARSIASIGYLPLDRFVIAPYDKNQYFVIEGNRRLAALRLILKNPDEFLVDNVSKFKSIPALCLDEPPNQAYIDQWLLQGTRHVGGVKEWGPYQKAKAVDILHRERGMEYFQIAIALGLNNNEVTSALRTLKAFELLQLHPKFGNRAKPEHFSILAEMIKKPALRKYFGWDNNSMCFIDNEKRDKFFLLFLGDPGNHLNPKISKALGLREVTRIIQNPEAKESFEDMNKPMSEAYFLSFAKPEPSFDYRLIQFEKLFEEILTYIPQSLDSNHIDLLSRVKEKIDSLLKKHYN